MALEKLNFVSSNYENVRVSNAKSAMEKNNKKWARKTQNFSKNLDGRDFTHHA